MARAKRRRRPNSDFQVRHRGKSRRSALLIRLILVAVREFRLWQLYGMADDACMSGFRRKKQVEPTTYSLRLIACVHSGFRARRATKKPRRSLTRCGGAGTEKRPKEWTEANPVAPACQCFFFVQDSLFVDNALNLCSVPGQPWSLNLPKTIIVKL